MVLSWLTFYLFHIILQLNNEGLTLRLALEANKTKSNKKIKLVCERIAEAEVGRRIVEAKIKAS